MKFPADLEARMHTPKQVSEKRNSLHLCDVENVIEQMTNYCTTSIALVAVYWGNGVIARIWMELVCVCTRKDTDIGSESISGSSEKSTSAVRKQSFTLKIASNRPAVRSAQQKFMKWQWNMVDLSKCVCELIDISWYICHAFKWKKRFIQILKTYFTKRWCWCHRHHAGVSGKTYDEYIGHRNDWCCQPKFYQSINVSGKKKKMLQIPEPQFTVIYIHK